MPAAAHVDSIYYEAQPRVWRCLHLIETKGPFTMYQESLKAWRSLIIFTVATYVRYVYSPTSKYVILKAKINPSQKSATDAHIYESWTMIHKDTGSVKTGHRTCMAGWVWLLFFSSKLWSYGMRPAFETLGEEKYTAKLQQSCLK